MTINPYATLVECKASYPDNSLNATTTYDTLATTLIDRCSRQFDKWTNRKPGAYFVDADVTRYPTFGKKLNTPVSRYDERLGGGYSGGLKLWIGELAAAPTSVAVSLTGSITTYTTYASTDFICGPYDALDDGRPFQWLEIDIFNGSNFIWSGYPKGNKVVGKFGYATATPADIKEAIILMVIRLLRKAQQNYVETGVLLDSGQVMQGMKLDQDIADVITHYRKMAI